MALIIIRQLNLTAITSATDRTPAQAYVFKRGTTPAVGVRFVDETGSTVTYPVGSLITLGFKAPNAANQGITAFDGPYTISGSTAAAPDVNGVYWIPISFSSAALNTALGYNPPTVNDDVLSVVLAGEVRIDAGADIEKSLTFSAIVFHDINTGAEAAATAATAPYPLLWMTISRLAGGLVTDLDAQPTAGVLAPGYATILMAGFAGVNAGALTVWQLQADTGAVGAGYQRPLDFNAASNNVVWVKIL